MTFDLGNERIFLAKGFDFETTKEEYSIGIGILRRNRKTIVAAVQPDSLAEQAGFLVNDVLVVVAGEEIGEKPIAEIRWMVETKLKSNGCLTLGVRRTGKMHSLTVTAD